MLLVVVSVFLLLFLSGMRFSIYLSLLLATLDTLFILGIYYAFFYLFIKSSKRFKGSVLYLICIILFLITFSLLLVNLEVLLSKLFMPVIPKIISEEQRHHILMFRFLKNMILTLGTFSVAQFNYLRIQEAKATQMAIEKEHVRFQLLKAQVNPHFLFNALNNIYALAYTNDEKAPDAVMKLSDILRYVIDMISSDKVQLNREIDFIRTYLDFQAMRLGNQADIRFEADVDNAYQFIAPMILQPYIENCFNHGDISTNPKGYVHITLHVKNKKLNFTLSNSKGVVCYDLPNQQGGLGELNVEERLQFFYSDAFTLSIKEEDNHYSVSLHIDLNQN